MKESKVIKDIIVQIIAALLIQIILYGIGYVFSFASKEKISITVCASTKDINGYSTSINLRNYQNDKSISRVIIWSSAKIDEKSITYNSFDVYDNRIVLNNLPPLYDETIILKSIDEINENNTQFETDEKLEVTFLQNQKEKIYSYWKNIIPNCIVFIVIYSAMACWMNIYTCKEKEIQQKEIKRIEDSEKEIEEKYKEIYRIVKEKENENMKMREGQLKLKIFLHRKLSDYAKELDFYKRLIKSIITKNSNNDDICYMITKELKTYKTLDKINAEDLELDILSLSEIEKEEIKNDLFNKKE